MLQLYTQLNQEVVTIGGSSNNIKLKIYSSNDPISNAYLIGQSNQALYITSLCNLPTYVGIGTNTPITNLHVIGNTVISNSLTVGTVTTQNNIINLGSGTLYGTIFANTITAGQITTQNNTINAGSGIIYASNIYIMGNIYDSNNQPYTSGGGGGGFTSGQSITTGTITTQNNIINTGSGAIYSANVQALNLFDIFKNISQNQYIDSVILSNGPIVQYENVQIYISILGNSLLYSYNVYIDTNPIAINTNTLSVSGTSTTVTTNFSYSFSGGNHSLKIIATTGGSGYGSSASNTLSISISDPVRTPAMFIYNSANISASGNTINVSGIPYYTSGASITFSQNSLGFSNTYNVSPPSMPIFLTLSDSNNYIQASNYQYTNIFLSPFFDYNQISSNSLQFIYTLLNSNILDTTSPITLTATLSNINTSYPAKYNNGIPTSLRGTQYFSNIAYLSTSISEYSQFPNLTAYLSSISRVSLSNNSCNISTLSNVLNPIINIDTVQYPSQVSTMSYNDAIYSVYDKSYYQAFSNMTAYSNNGLIFPPLQQSLTNSLNSKNYHHNLLFQITPAASISRFGSFSIQLEGATNSIGRIFVNWGNSGWYDANSNSSITPFSLPYGGSGGGGVLNISSNVAIQSAIPGTSQINKYYIKAPLWSHATQVPIYINIYLNTQGSIKNNSNFIIQPTERTKETGIPSVNIINSINMQLSSPSCNYISGIPYYTSPTTITFPKNNLQFAYVYDVVDPIYYGVSNLLTLGSISQSNYAYSNVFSYTISTTNDSNSLIYTLRDTAEYIYATPTPYLLQSSVSNVNTVTNSNSFMSIAYINPLSTSLNETDILNSLRAQNKTYLYQIGTSNQNTGSTPIATALTRNSLTDNTSTSNVYQPLLSKVTPFINGINTMCNNDVFYSLYDGTFYQSSNSMINYNAYYHPTIPSQPGNHSNLIIAIPTAGYALESFNFTFGSSSTYPLDGLYVQWNSIGGWCNANSLYTTAGGDGCGLTANQISTNQSSTINIKSPNLLPLSGSINDIVYLNIQLKQSSNIIASNIIISTPTSDATLGQPKVTVSQYSSNNTAGDYTYISGMPFYNSNSTFIYPPSGLYFSNVYNAIDPKLLSFSNNLLQFKYNIGPSSYITVSCNYTSLFNSTFCNVPNAYQVNLSLSTTSGYNPPTYTLPLTAILSNATNFNGISNNINTLAFCNISFNESNLLGLGAHNQTYRYNNNLRNNSSLIASEFTRYSIINNTANIYQPDLSDLAPFISGIKTMSNNDVYYSIYDGGTFYQSASSMSTYLSYTHPTVSSQSGNHSNLIIAVTTSGNSLESFKFNSSTSFSGFYVQWQSIGEWYNAKTSYINGGCGLSGNNLTSTSINIKSPNLLPPNAADTIYLNIQLFQGSSLTLSSIYISTPLSTDDSIGTPSVTGITFNSTQDRSRYTYISGIPYYSSNCILTFLPNSLNFTNIYNQIDPKLLSLNILNFTDTNSLLSVSCNYTSLFSTTALNPTNAYSVNLNLSGVYNNSTVINISFYTLVINATVNNVKNIQKYNPYFTLAFLNTTSSLDYIDLFPSLLNASAYNSSTNTNGLANDSTSENLLMRYSVVVNDINVGASSNILIGNSNGFGQYISKDDIFFSPYDQKFYQNYSSIPIINDSSYISPPSSLYNMTYVTNSAGSTYSTPHSFLLFRIHINSYIKQFYIRMSSSTALNIQNILVKWEPYYQWYTAKLRYNGNNGNNNSYACGDFVWNADLSKNTSIKIYLGDDRAIASALSGYMYILYQCVSNASIPLSDIRYSTT